MINVFTRDNMNRKKIYIYEYLRNYCINIDACACICGCFTHNSFKKKINKI